MNKNVFDYYTGKMKLDKNKFQVHPLVVNAENLYMAFSKKSKRGSDVIDSFNIELGKITKLKKPGQ